MHKKPRSLAILSSWTALHAGTQILYRPYYRPKSVRSDFSAPSRAVRAAASWDWLEDGFCVEATGKYSVHDMTDVSLLDKLHVAGPPDVLREQSAVL